MPIGWWWWKLKMAITLVIDITRPFWRYILQILHGNRSNSYLQDYDENQNGHNSANFEVKTSRFCIVIRYKWYLQVILSCKILGLYCKQRIKVDIQERRAVSKLEVIFLYFFSFYVLTFFLHFLAFCIFSAYKLPCKIWSL